MNALRLKLITKTVFACIAILGGCLLPALSFADGKAVSVDIHAETPVTPLCGTLKNFAGEVMVLDSSRAHVDEASRGRGIPCEGWLSVQTGWVEFKHRDGHIVRVGENSFVQLTGGADTLTLLRGVVHLQTFDDGADLRVVTPNGRARLKQGTGLISYSPSTQRTQWVTLERMALFENRFEPESHVAVAAGEASVLDLSKPRVIPSTPKAITVASLKPILKALDISEKQRNTAIEVALTRQRRVLASSIVHVAPEGSEMRSPASIKENAKAYHRHAPEHRDAKAEKHLAKKWSGGAPVSLLEPELLEMRLEAKAAARDRAEKERIMRQLDELERKPASERE